MLISELSQKETANNSAFNYIMSYKVLLSLFVQTPMNIHIVIEPIEPFAYLFL